jgi:hypothetical protein
MVIFLGTPELESRDFGRPYLPTAESNRNAVWSKVVALVKSFSMPSQIGCREEVDSRFVVVGSQTTNLTPSLSFGHNLCFRRPNDQCEPILEIYVPRAFRWYKERNNPLRFDPSTRPLKFQGPPGLPLPKWELPWECECSLTLPRTSLNSRASSLLGPQPCNPFALVASPKLGLRLL